jgi:hypothetical protein
MLKVEVENAVKEAMALPHNEISCDSFFFLGDII